MEINSSEINNDDDNIYNICTNDFLKLYNNCKYNLISLNKKFDLFDCFLRNLLNKKRLNNFEDNKIDDLNISQNDIEKLTKNYLTENKKKNCVKKNKKINNDFDCCVSEKKKRKQIIDWNKKYFN